METMCIDGSHILEIVSLIYIYDWDFTYNVTNTYCMYHMVICTFGAFFFAPKV